MEGNGTETILLNDYCVASKRANIDHNQDPERLYFAFAPSSGIEKFLKPGCERTSSNNDEICSPASYLYVTLFPQASSPSEKSDCGA